jgi:hypothetical protein
VEGRVDLVRVVKKDGFPELDEARARAVRYVDRAKNGKGDSMEVDYIEDDGSVDNSPLLNVVERWLREDYKRRTRGLKKKGADGKLMTKWEMLVDKMKTV